MNFPMEAVYALLAVLMGLIISLVAFDSQRRRQRLILGVVLAATTFALMMVMDRTLGVAAGWNVFALLFCGIGAWQAQKVFDKTFFRDPQPWDGHKAQNPETEEFSDGLLLTTNELTGARHGVVLSGPFGQRELHAMTDAELDGLAADLAGRDEKGHNLLTKYRNWKISAS